jgi:hypothetical protein
MSMTTTETLVRKLASYADTSVAEAIDRHAARMAEAISCADDPDTVRACMAPRGADPFAHPVVRAAAQRRLAELGHRVDAEDVEMLQYAISGDAGDMLPAGAVAVSGTLPDTCTTWNASARAIPVGDTLVLLATTYDRGSLLACRLVQRAHMPTQAQDWLDSCAAAFPRQPK